MNQRVFKRRVRKERKNMKVRVSMYFIELFIMTIGAASAN